MYILWFNNKIKLSSLGKGCFSQYNPTVERVVVLVIYNMRAYSSLPKSMKDCAIKYIHGNIQYRTRPSSATAMCLVITQSQIMLRYTLLFYETLDPRDRQRRPQPVFQHSVLQVTHECIFSLSRSAPSGRGEILLCMIKGLATHSSECQLQKQPGLSLGHRCEHCRAHARVSSPGVRYHGFQCLQECYMLRVNWFIIPSGRQDL